MKFIADFQEGDKITAHYLCKKKETKKTKAGKNYLNVILSDKTGTIDCKVWELNNHIQHFETGDFIKVEGNISIYNEEFQMSASKIRKSIPGEYLPIDYMPSTEKNIDDMFTGIEELIASVENEHLFKLLSAIFIENDEISEAFRRHSAGKNMHHGYMGGLCEHILSVARLCDFLAPKYKFVDRDLLVTAALLHDIGKLYELSPFPTNDYTDEGQLIGHIIIGYGLVQKESEKIEGFPEKLRSLLLHCILSHHGKREFGSPIEPRTMEACILSYADISDAHIKMFEELLAKAPANSEWSQYSKVLGRELRKTIY